MLINLDHVNVVILRLDMYRPELLQLAQVHLVAHDSLQQMIQWLTALHDFLLLGLHQVQKPQELRKFLGITFSKLNLLYSPVTLVISSTLCTRRSKTAVALRENRSFSRNHFRCFTYSLRNWLKLATSCFTERSSAVTSVSMYCCIWLSIELFIGAKSTVIHPHCSMSEVKKSSDKMLLWSHVAAVRFPFHVSSEKQYSLWTLRQFVRSINQ